MNDVYLGNGVFKALAVAFLSLIRKLWVVEDDYGVPHRYNVEYKPNFSSEKRVESSLVEDDADRSAIELLESKGYVVKLPKTETLPDSLYIKDQDSSFSAELHKFSVTKLNPNTDILRQNGVFLPSYTQLVAYVFGTVTDHNGNILHEDEARFQLKKRFPHHFLSVTRGSWNEESIYVVEEME